ncbi:MAG: glycoside hydrolase family 65 protein [Kiritimatiellia bacterium]
MDNLEPLWTLTYDTYDPENEKHQEALLTVGNGYMGCRGAAEESKSSPHHYPGTYIAGIYNRLVSRVGDRDVENEDFVNAPNWTCISFRPEGGTWFDIDDCEILSFKRVLDVRRGLLHRDVRIKQPDGKISRIESTRLVSMAHRHLGAMRYCVTPENYSGNVTLRSGLDGAIRNAGVERYNDLNQDHLARHKEKLDSRGIVLSVLTTQSKVVIVERAVHRVVAGHTELTHPTKVVASDRKIMADFLVTIEPGETIVLEKRVAIETSRDTDVSDPRIAAIRCISNGGNWEQLLTEHVAAWDRIWQQLDIAIEGDDDALRINRLHAYHLLCAASPFNAQIDAGIPARGLHGEAYRGHIFWDEIFVLPLFNLLFPEVAKALLLYRHRRLDAARAYARKHGYQGAMFPWQSGSDGREETQVVHLNPVSGAWGDDYSCLQRHVSLAIAYNTWQYVHMTGDTAFLEKYGAEMLLSIALFWSHRCQLDPHTQRYSIEGVMGPNEFHEKMHGADKGGLKDNAYTNIMTVWLLERALETIQALPVSVAQDLLPRLGIDETEQIRWLDITRRMFVGIKDGLIDQYDGFLDLAELDWDAYRSKYGDIGRMDRLLKAEGKDPDAYQLSKQGDLMMLFFVLPFSTVQQILQTLGIPFSLQDLRRNYEYYEQRTSHGSTLSLGVHAHIANLLGDTETAMQWYHTALHADLGDIQGGTTKEGIHIALMASTLSLILFSFAGIDVSGDVLKVAPALPPSWQKVAFSITFRGTKYHLSISTNDVQVQTEGQQIVTIEINNQALSLSPGQPVSLPHGNNTRSI